MLLRECVRTAVEAPLGSSLPTNCRKKTHWQHFSPTRWRLLHLCAASFSAEHILPACVSECVCARGWGFNPSPGGTGCEGSEAINSNCSSRQVVPTHIPGVNVPLPLGRSLSDAVLDGAGLRLPVLTLQQRIKPAAVSRSPRPR